MSSILSDEGHATPAKLRRSRLAAFTASPERILVTSFLGLILLGAGVLHLPVSHRDAAAPVGLLDCLFISTSAVCVTGLATVDTPARFSGFGMTVILLLIQLGGLGIMTFGSLAMYLFGLRLSFTSHAAWQIALFEGEVRGGVRRAVQRIVLTALGIELIGAVLIYVGMQGGTPCGGLPHALFLSISAFCNAGFSVFSDNLIGVRDRPLITYTIMALIVLGGLGFGVLLEAGTRLGARLRGVQPMRVQWTLHSRVVLGFSALLIIGGAAAIYFGGLTPGEPSWQSRLDAALFSSVTARTAGFNTIDFAALPPITLLFMIVLMFIGGSPASCAGGVKTTTFVAWLAGLRAQLSAAPYAVMFGRCLPPDVVQRATLVISVAVVWNLLGVAVLVETEAARNVPFVHLVFEQISAFGTVGLSCNVTPGLSSAGKLWIALTMFMGRLGPLTLALAVLPSPRRPYKFPTERVMIG